MRAADDDGVLPKIEIRERIEHGLHHAIVVAQQIEVVVVEDLPHVRSLSRDVAQPVIPTDQILHLRGGIRTITYVDRCAGAVATEAFQSIALFTGIGDGASPTRSTSRR